MTEKKCFVIFPIGQKGSNTRKRSETVFKHIICKALEDYQLIRADHIEKPGQITMQVIENIVEFPIMIADLTDNNANVFYELSLRHALGKPAILIIQEDQIPQVPFDLKDMRIIPYKVEDPDRIEKTKEDIANYAKGIEEVLASDNIISRYVKLAPISEPAGPDDIRVTLGTINIGNRFRYELIEPFFERLAMDFNERLERLRKTFKILMEESKGKDYLKRVNVKSAFISDRESYEKIEKLFCEVETIIPKLAQAMFEEDEDKIASSLEQWRENNKAFMKIAAKRFLELMVSS